MSNESRVDVNQTIVDVIHGCVDDNYLCVDINHNIVDTNHLAVDIIHDGVDIIHLLVDDNFLTDDAPDDHGMTITFTAAVWHWRGPAPFYFLTIPEDESRRIKEIERLSTYGWGMIPVVARIGKTEFSTSLWPKGAAYVLPLKVVVRKAEGIDEGDQINAQIEVVMAH